MEAQFKEEEEATEEGTVDVQQQWVGWYVCACYMSILLCYMPCPSHTLMSYIVKSVKSGESYQPMLHPRTCLTYGIAV